MIPLRPLAKVLGHVIFVAGGTLFRVLRQSYVETVNNTTLKMGSREMSLDEAIKILDIKYTGNKPVFKAPDLSITRDRLIKLNSPTKNFGGSPYLIARINDAHKTIIAKATVKD